MPIRVAKGWSPASNGLKALSFICIFQDSSGYSMLRQSTVKFTKNRINLPLSPNRSIYITILNGLFRKCICLCLGLKSQSVVYSRYTVGKRLNG